MPDTSPARLAVLPAGSVAEGQSGTTTLTFTLRRAALADNGSSFPLGNGSVRVITDGTSNTVLFGEGNATFTGTAAEGVTASFSDGSVRFISDTLNGWQYQRRNAAGTLVAQGPLADDTGFTFGDGSVRFLADGTSNTILFGEQQATLQGSDAAGWQVAFGDGTVRQLGTTDGFLPGAGTATFTDTGASFRLGDGSVRVITDGVSNTVLLGVSEGGETVFTEDGSGGVTATLGDGSVRFINDPAGGWQYQRRNGTGETVAEGPLANGTTFTFGDGSVRFLADGTSNTVLFGEEQATLRRAPGGSWSAELGDGTIRQLGDGRRITYQPGTHPFAAQGTSVAWSVAGSGPAPADAADFPGAVLPSGTVSFAPGQTTATIAIAIAADTLPEPDEGLTLTLSSPAAGTVIATASATATLLNDDGPPALISVARQQAARAEGQSGATAFTFLATRTGNTTGAATAGWSVTGGGLANTVATNAADFIGGVLPSGTVSFAPGQASRTITVSIAGDAAPELNESFTLTLHTPSPGAALGTATATGLVWNDDTPGTGTLAIARAQAQRAEGSGGGTTPFTFTVTRSGDTSGTAAADWVVTGGGVANTLAANAADFAGGIWPSGRVNFAAGQGAATITVNVAADAAIELNDSFTVTLAAPQAGVSIVTATATGAILNDDPAGTGTLSIARASAQAAEGHAGTTALTFAVTRAGDLSGAAAADWAVADGAVPGTVKASAADFAGARFPSGRLTFAPGEATRLLTIQVAGDEAAELNESFAVTLANPQSGVALGTATATGVILNDDFASTAASQVLTGTAAADLFLLGGGLDTVYGRGGTDLFRFRPQALGPASGNAATLEDFNPAAGERIDLAGIDAIAATLANDAFAFIGSAAFAAAPGQLRWQGEGAFTRIEGDVNGDAVADLTILVRTTAPPDAAWFLL